MLTLDQLIKSDVEKPTVYGRFFQIQAIPDVVTQERFNIGVALDVDGKFYCKLLNNYERIKCLYGESYINTIKIFVEAAKACVDDNALSSSNHLVFSERSTFKGRSVEEILNFLFEDTVPLNRPTQKQLIEKKESKSHLNGLIQFIRNYAKQNYGSIASEYFPEDNEILVKHGELTVPVNIPIRSGRKLGAIILANQKSALSVENNLNRGASNIHIAKNTDKDDRRCGVVLLTSPFDQVPDRNIESKLDHFYVDMQTSNIDIISHTSKESLAQEALTWAIG